MGAAGPVAVVLSFWPPPAGFVLLAPLTRFGPWLRANEGLGLLTYFMRSDSCSGFRFVPTYSAVILRAGLLDAAWLAAGNDHDHRFLAAGLSDRAMDRTRPGHGSHSGKSHWHAIDRTVLAERSGRATLVVALLRVLPASPFALVNFARAAARVPLVEYIIGTFPGIAPRTALATFAAGLEQLRFKDGANHGRFSPELSRR